MSGERTAPTLVADLTNLQQELRELHQRVRTAAEQGRKEAGDGRDGDPGQVAVFRSARTYRTD